MTKTRHPSNESQVHALYNKRACKPRKVTRNIRGTTYLAPPMSPTTNFYLHSLRRPSELRVEFLHRNTHAACVRDKSSCRARTVQVPQLDPGPAALPIPRTGGACTGVNLSGDGAVGRWC